MNAGGTENKTKGTLYIVATPIGNLGDLSPRAREVLGAVQGVAAEDTRHTGALLRSAGIQARLLSLHEHNEAARTPELVRRLQRGESLALVSDAGTPLVSDPGYRLVQAALRAGAAVSPVPGPCAAIAALSVAGLPSDRFTFEGFLPPKPAARRARIAELARDARTLVFYEAPHRLRACLSDLAVGLGGTRAAAIARELTKAFETVYRGPLQTLLERAQTDADLLRGELVVLVAGAPEAPAGGAEEILDRVLSALLQELPLAQAARLAAAATGLSRNRAYRRALELAGADPAASVRDPS